MKELQTYNAGNDDVVSVIWLDDDHQPVSPDKATSARMTFSSGEAAVFVVERPETARDLAEFDESQHPRDERGKFAPTISKGSFLHGTARARVRSILEQGLQPSTPGIVQHADNVAGHVYLTNKFDRAKRYAHEASRRADAEVKRKTGQSEAGYAVPVILEIELPSEVKQALSRDKNYSKSDRNTYSHEGIIKPEWIKRIHILEGDPYHTRERMVEERWRTISAKDLKNLAAADIWYVPVAVVSDRLENLARRETQLHKVADSHAPRVEVAVRLAFALGRKAIGRSRDAEKAVKAIRTSLEETLPKVLRKVYVAGGEAAGGMLRAAEFDPNQERDERGRWTDGGSAKEVEVTDELLRIATKDSEALRYPHKGDIESDVQGVIVGSARALDKSINRGDTTIETVKEDFKATREHLREKYGDTLKLYRVDAPVEKHSKQTLTVYMGDRKLADRFGKSRPYEVKIDEVVGVFATKSGYYEFIVEKPKGGLRGLELRTAKRGDEDKKVKRIGPLAFTFDSASEQAIDWADRHAAELIDGISETSKEAINNAIAEALESGTDPYEAILDAVGDEDRAHLIAHHEVMMAVHEGQREAWRQATDQGLLTGDERPTWIVTGDDKVCPICEGLEGKTRDLDGQYKTEDGEFDGPPAHPRCRCTEGLT